MERPKSSPLPSRSCMDAACYCVIVNLLFLQPRTRSARQIADLLRGNSDGSPMKDPTPALQQFFAINTRRSPDPRTRLIFVDRRRRSGAAMSSAPSKEKFDSATKDPDKLPEKSMSPPPPPPEKPEPGDCCGSGCVRCVWDVYYEELDAYNKLYQEPASDQDPNSKY